MTAAIAFHPKSLAQQPKTSQEHVSGTLFVYALIGMVVGFLVMHHGAIIGFVIFGIGGLLRFRTDVDSMTDTMRLILVTLIGLCVGLDLPVMGVITTVSAWAILFFFSGAPHHVVDVKFATKAGVSQGRMEIEKRLKSEGFTVAGVKKAKAKLTFHSPWLACARDHGTRCISR